VNKWGRKLAITTGIFANRVRSTCHFVHQTALERFSRVVSPLKQNRKPAFKWKLGINEIGKFRETIGNEAIGSEFSSMNLRLLNFTNFNKFLFNT
jgi:hypothetical protein